MIPETVKVSWKSLPALFLIAISLIHLTRGKELSVSFICEKRSPKKGRKVWREGGSDRSFQRLFQKCHASLNKQIWHKSRGSFMKLWVLITTQVFLKTSKLHNKLESNYFISQALKSLFYLVLSVNLDPFIVHFQAIVNTIFLSLSLSMPNFQMFGLLFRLEIHFCSLKCF